MLMRRRRQPTPTFLEGTPGRYLRRDAPPVVPSSPPIPQQQQQQASSSNMTFSMMSNGVISTMATTSSSSPSVTTTKAVSPKAIAEQRRKTTIEQDFAAHYAAASSSLTGFRKNLTPSLSIGNVVQHSTAVDAQLPTSTYQRPQQRLVSVSLQNLPAGRAMGSSIIASGESPVEDDLPLPPNWAVEVTAQNIRYYVDHNTQRTHWLHPFARENLPTGWTKLFDQTHGVVYYNELDGRSQFEHPGLATPTVLATDVHGSSGALSTNRTESTIDNLNIISEDIPGFLLMYSTAPSACDHMLEWDLFRPQQLEQYDRMLLKLYKQEVIDTVIRYERMRRLLEKEIAARQSPSGRGRGTGTPPRPGG